MIRALVTQLVEALDESRGDVSQCLQEELPKAGYERYDRRIKAITEQLEKHDDAIKAAREYLATEPSGERAELIEKLRWAGSVGGNQTCIQAADMLAADAQQAKRVPMAGEEIEKIADGCRAGAGSVWPHAFARALEAHHKILPAEKGTQNVRTLTDWGQP